MEYCKIKRLIKLRTKQRFEKTCNLCKNTVISIDANNHCIDCWVKIQFGKSPRSIKINSLFDNLKINYFNEIGHETLHTHDKECICIKCKYISK